MTKEFGDLVQNYRTKQELSINKAAQLTQIDTSYLSRIEHGERNLGPEKSLRLMEVLKIAPDSASALEFLLYAAGHSSVTINLALGSITDSLSKLSEIQPEILLLTKSSEGWKVQDVISDTSRGRSKSFK